MFREIDALDPRRQEILRSPTSITRVPSTFGPNALDSAAVWLKQAGGKFPAEVVLGHLEQQRIPTGVQGYIDFVRTGLEWASNVVGVDEFAIEPHFDS